MARVENEKAGNGREQNDIQRAAHTHLRECHDDRLEGAAERQRDTRIVQGDSERSVGNNNGIEKGKIEARRLSSKMQRGIGLIALNRGDRI